MIGRHHDRNLLARSVDFWGVTKASPNATWVYEADADGFFDLLTDRLGRL